MSSEGISIAKLNEMKKAAEEAKKEKADLTDSSTSKKNIRSQEEKRVDKIGTYLKPSEKKKFINMIGRKTESDAVRELILEFIKKDSN